MSRWLILLVFVLCPCLAKAECTFQKRSDDFFFRKLPAEIGGWIKCSDSDINVIYVARLAPRTNVMGWWKRYESVVAVAPVSTDIVEKTLSPRGTTWMEIETQRSLDHLRHFMTLSPQADGSILVFLSTDTPARARRLRGRIKDLMRAFSMEDYEHAIKRALD